jgi:hypothetical protein
VSAVQSGAGLILALDFWQIFSCLFKKAFENIFWPLSFGEREFLRATALNIYIDTCLPLSSAFVLLHTSGYFIFYV